MARVGSKVEAATTPEVRVTRGPRHRKKPLRHQLPQRSLSKEVRVNIQFGIPLFSFSNVLKYTGKRRIAVQKKCCVSVLKALLGGVKLADKEVIIRFIGIVIGI